MAVPPKLSYDIQSAIESGLNAEDIARHVSGRRGYDYQGAREAGLSDDDIIQYNVANVRDVGGLRLAAEEAALTAATTAPAGLLGLTKGFSTGLRTPGPPIVKFVGGLSGALLGGAFGTAVGQGAKEVIREATGTAGQITPGARPFEVAGETFGFVTTGFTPTVARGAFAKLGQTALGRKLGLATEATVKPVNLGAAEFLAVASDNPGMRAAFNRTVGRKLKKGEEFLTAGFETAARSPGATLLAETTAGGSAAIAGGLSEELFPGNLGARLISELAAGVVNPTSIVLGAIPDIFKSIKTRFPGGGGGRERAKDKIARGLAEMRDNLDDEEKAIFDEVYELLIKNEGETVDPITIDINAARETKRGKPTFTSAEKTNNLLLRTIEQIVMQRDPKARREIMSRSRAGSQAVARLLDELKDPEFGDVLDAAARGQNALFNKRITEILNLRIATAIDRAERIRGTGDEAAEQAGREIKDGISKALEDVRKIETQLYRNVTTGAKYSDIPMDADNVVQTYDNEFIDFPERKAEVKTYIKRFIDRAKGKADEVEETVDVFPELIPEGTNVRLSPVFERDGQPTRTLVRTDDAPGNPGVAEELGSVVQLKNGQFKATRNIWPRDDDVVRDVELKPEFRITRGDGSDATPADLVKSQTRVFDADEEADAIRFMFSNQDNIRFGATDKVEDAKRKFDTLRNIDAVKTKKAPVDKKEVKGISSGDLIKFRSEMLRLAREAKGEGPSAGFFSKLAQAADEDIGAKNFSKLTQAQKDQLSKTEYEFREQLSAANAFSKQLNDVFTRAFGGEILAKTVTGRDRLIPEQLRDKFLSGSGLASTVRANELDQALEFAIKARTDTSGAMDERTLGLEALQGYMLGAEETIVRAAANATMDGDQVNLGRLRTFLRRDGDFIRRKFPNLFKELQNAETAEVLLKSTQERMKRIQQAVDRSPASGRATFRTFLGKNSNPSAVLDRLIGVPGVNPTPNAERNISRLIQEARRAKSVPGAVEALKFAVYDSAFRHARGAGDEIDFKKLRRYLFEPLGVKQDSLMDLLQRKGVLENTSEVGPVNEFANLKKLVDRGVSFQETLSTRLAQDSVDLGDAEELIGQIGAFESLVARAIGADTASKLAGRLGLSRQSLIIPAGGARFAETILSRMPQGQAWDVLVEAAQDPKLMADLFARAESRRERQQLFKSRRLKAALTTVGGRALADILEPSKYRGSPTTADRDPEAMRRTIRNVPPGQTIQGQQRRPVAPPARQVAPTPQAAPRPQRPPAAPQSNLQQSRRQFAELFPTDITSGIIRSQN